MAFLAGENITAGRLNNLQPVEYHDTGTTDVPASSTNADIPGMSIPITTLTANAGYSAVIAISIYNTTAAAASASARLHIDGVGTGAFAIYSDGDSSGKATVTQTFKGTIATPGAHTLKIVATTPAGVTIKSSFSTMLVTITEVA